VLGVAAALWAGLPDLGREIEEAPETLGDWTYGFGALMAFLELGTLVGVLAPFEVGVILSGALAGEGEISVVTLGAIVFAGGTVGETLNFWLGERYGRSLLVKTGPRYRITPARLHRVEEHFERHGGVTVLVARFVPFARSLTPFVAGSSLMLYRRFLPWSVAGNVLWAVVGCGIGYAFYRSADAAAEVAGTVGLVVLGLLVLAAAVLLLRARRRRAHTASHADQQNQ
jgi:membrane protein DedA with SNARE-associated domain